MRNALVLFTKVPKAGETKTRLTTERGGIFTPEEAKEFYEATLLDVLDSCIAADCCDVYVCHDADGDVTYLQSLLNTLASPKSIRMVFPDQGGSFDRGMQYAVDRILKNGADERLADSVLIVGGDMPPLQSKTIQEAVKRLETLASIGNKKEESAIGAAMVVSADQECGFNILGYTCTTPFNFDGVFYNQDGVTALDMISYKVAEQKIPLAVLEIVPDVDLPVDMAGFISMVKSMQLAAQYDSTVTLPKRTIKVLEDMGLEASAPVPR